MHIVCFELQPFRDTTLAVTHQRLTKRHKLLQEEQIGIS